MAEAESISAKMGGHFFYLNLFAKHLYYCWLFLDEYIVLPMNSAYSSVIFRYLLSQAHLSPGPTNAYVTAEFHLSFRRHLKLPYTEHPGAYTQNRTVSWFCHHIKSKKI